MLAVRDQENLASSRQHGAAMKQQQGQASRQLGSKTPGAKFSKTPMKIPLNDENGANGMTSKALKGGEMSTFVTPMTHRARAVLGDKTTNAKAKGLQTVNGKSTQVKPQNTVRPKQREPQVETHKLQVHAESDSSSEDEVEYCPPKLEHRPYESDVFPDRVLSFDALKANNMMKGYYRYYFNPVDERGATKYDRELRAEMQRKLEEFDRKMKQDLDELEWSVKAELGSDMTATVPKKALAATKLPVPRNPLSTMRSRFAADVLSIDDTTNSLQRKMAKTSGVRKPVHQKSSSFAIPTLKMNRPATSLAITSIPKKSSAELDATSRTTLGYNKGRAAAASLLTKTTKTSADSDDKNTSGSTSTLAFRAALPRSHTTLSDYADRTITPALYANNQASAADEEDDQVWKERVPFLSIFNPDHIGDGGEDGEDEDEEHDPFGIQNKAPAFNDSDDDHEFELKLAD